MLKAGDEIRERYRLQRQLGRTAAGRETWLALDRETEERVTLKFLAFSPQMQWEELKLFEREAQILQSLAHPRIPRYRDYFTLDKRQGDGVPLFVLVQDYLPGASLQELLVGGRRFSDRDIRDFAEQILDILIYLHELSPPVLHRDIKPSNLILGEDEAIYLIDFGAVQDKAAVTGVTFTVVGTSGYAPLEQFWGRAVPASDLYGMGATLIHLLTGIAPVDLPHQGSKLDFRDRVGRLDADLVNWLETLTDSILEQRYGSAREALEILQGRRTPVNPQAVGLRKLPRPKGSIIHLQKSAVRLFAHLPSLGKRSLARLDGIRAFTLLLVSGMLAPLIAMWTIALLVHPVGLIVGSLILAGIAKTLGESICFEFDRSHFEVRYSIFNCVYSRLQVAIGEVWGIYLLKEGHSYRIYLRSERGNHRLSRDLSEQEGTWLLQEIQDWLYGQ